MRRTGRLTLRVGRPAAAVLVLGAAAWIAWPLPDGLVRDGGVPGLEIQDRHGLVLRTTRARDGRRGGWIPLAEVDPELIRAFAAAEDHRFFEHGGVDLRAIARAARDNLAAATSSPALPRSACRRLGCCVPRLEPGRESSCRRCGRSGSRRTSRRGESSSST